MTERIEVVKIIIQNSEGQFLALKKSDNYDWKANKWELPGGKVQKGEDKIPAARREVKQETGIEIDHLEDVTRIEIEEFGNDKPVINCWIVHTEDFTGQPDTSDEHQEFRWVAADEFNALDWHKDAGYTLPALYYLNSYMT